MTNGIEVRMKISSPGDCPVAKASTGAGPTVDSVNWSHPDDEDTITEEFSVSTELPGSDQHVWKYADMGDGSVYRFNRSLGDGCVCERVERHAGPVEDVSASNGCLYLTFKASDLEAVHEVTHELRDTFDGVTLCYIHQATEPTHQDPVFIDRATMTERQREVLSTAYEMGYFEHPKGANASEVADSLGICRATFSEHLAAALRKVTGRVTETDSITPKLES